MSQPVTQSGAPAMPYQEASAFLGIAYSSLRKIILRGDLHPFRPPRSKNKMLYTAELEQYKHGERAGKSRAQETAQAEQAAQLSISQAARAALPLGILIALAIIDKLNEGYRLISGQIAHEVTTKVTSEYREAVADVLKSPLVTPAAGGAEQAEALAVLQQVGQIKEMTPEAMAILAKGAPVLTKAFFPGMTMTPEEEAEGQKYAAIGVAAMTKAQQEDQARKEREARERGIMPALSMAS